MKENIHYLKIKGGQIAIPGGIIPDQERYFLPNRDIMLIHTLYNQTPDEPIRHWQVYDLQGIPTKTEIIKIDKKKIDNIMKSYEKFKSYSRLAAQEVIEIGYNMRKSGKRLLIANGRDMTKSEREFFNKVEKVFKRV